jgi:hypothetical protein
MQDYAGGENRMQAAARPSGAVLPQMLGAVEGACEFVLSTSDQVVK